MRKDVKIYLNHILESIELIEEYTKDKTEDDFFTSKFLQDAVIRRIEIIGEAIKTYLWNLEKNITIFHGKNLLR